MIIKRYRNGVLVSEEIKAPVPPPKKEEPVKVESNPPKPLQKLPKQTPPPPQQTPKKGCGCGKKK